MEDWLAARARSTPHALALIIGSDQWSYAELDDLVNISADRISSFVKPGQHVGALMPNNLAFVCLIHALARIGAVLVPLNTRLSNDELSWQLDHSDCALVVATTGLAGRVSELVGQSRNTLLARNLFDRQTNHETVSRAVFNLERPQAIIFTSGTTGRPKGAVLSFANHFWSAASSAFRLGLHEHDRWLSCLPLYHVGGLAIILRSCLYGTAVVLHDRFDEQAISESLDTQAITLISLVPTMVHRLLDTRGNKPWPADLRHMLLGGAAAEPELVRRCRKLNLPLSITYGLTEATSQVATMLPHETYDKPGSAGKPILFTAVDIIGDQGQKLAPGDIGEICVSGPTVMTGYYENVQATELALRDGRLHTGDIGFLDEDGDLWLVQRRSDIIITGGENVYPSEVENVLQQHPAVAGNCVVGIPDPQWGQRVAAMIELHHGVSLTVDDLIDFGREKLAGYKIPRKVRFVDHLPLTASGKIHRQRVSEELADPSNSAQP